MQAGELSSTTSFVASFENGQLAKIYGSGLITLNTTLEQNSDSVDTVTYATPHENGCSYFLTVPADLGTEACLKGNLAVECDSGFSADYNLNCALI